MKPDIVKINYNQIKPSPQLSDFVDSYWRSENLTEKALNRTIFPDGFFKVIVTIIDREIVK